MNSLGYWFRVFGVCFDTFIIIILLIKLRRWKQEDADLYESKTHKNPSEKADARG